MSPTTGRSATKHRSKEALKARPGCLDGNGEACELARSVDWSKTAIGPVEGWSQALRSTASLVLHNHSGMLLWWGPEFVQIYNDAYRPVLGDKHPRAMGQRFRDCWSEVFHILGPMAERPFRGGPASTSDDIAVLINRKVLREETHFRLAYSPVPDETVEGTGIGGVLATVTEITDEVYADRQIRTLGELGARSVAATQSAEQACAIAAATLKENTWDVPFALFYLLDRSGEEAHLAASVGFDESSIEQVAPQHVGVSTEAGRSPWRLREVIERREVEIVTVPSRHRGALPASPWSEPSSSAIALPLASPDQVRPYGVLVCGVSPHRVLDAGYRAFFELVAAQIVTAVRNARALEEERKRSEALAEINRAKTLFFSNVSHEFRTPLTLMLGPVEEALANPTTPAGVRAQLELAHRNSLRLQKLVNSLLDFSRIEAGRVQASYEPTELADLTRDLASTFRSAVERAGLTYTVDCPAVGEPVYVDRGMWEKIVLNLLSNAFKYTLQGSITVRLDRDDSRVTLEVVDTGVGIPQNELPRVFERFHRVEGTVGRTEEGTGIGLALVQELVKLHGGVIGVTSELGQGTTVRVTLPLGAAHLPADRIRATRSLASTAISAKAFVQEALRWIPEVAEDTWSDLPALPEAAASGPFAKAAGAAVLVVDDNADMRAYVRELLAPHYRVAVASDGEQALEAVRRTRPDLVLSDIMMPKVDGLALLKALRADERLRDVPVILLSARAGEEARVEGLSAGADDYLVKPFSAQELLVRVGALIELTRMRRENERRFHVFVNATSEIIYRMSPDWTEMRDLHGRSLVADTSDPTRTWRDKYIHRDDQPLVAAAIEKAIRTKSVFRLEHRVRRIDGTLGWVLSRAIPLKDAEGNIVEWFGAATDMTERRATDQALREREEQLRLATEAAEVGLWDLDTITDTLYWPPRVKAMFGISADVPVSMADFYSGLYPGDRERTSEAFAAALDPKRRALYDVEYRTVGKEDGLIRWVAAKGRAVFDGYGKCVRVLGTAIDITARKHVEERLREEARVQELLGRINHALAEARLDTERVVQIATDAATEVSGAAFGAFFYNVQNEKGESYRLYALSGAPREAFAHFPQPRNTEVFGPTFSGESVVRSADITADPRYGHNPPYHGMPEGHLPVRSYLAVPVKSASGQALGSLFFGHPDPGVFDEHAERLVLAIAAQAAVAFDNATLHRSAQREIEHRRRMEHALSEADRQKDEFLAMLAHELRNPLAPIGNASEILLRMLGEDARARDVVSMIKRQSGHLTRLVDDLLDVSRITQGRIRLHRRPTDVTTIITQAVETVEPKLREKQHKLSVITATGYEPLYVDGDLARLVQCVVNVLSNASKYTDPGGEIRVQSRAEGPLAVIEISDNGAGIAPELLPTVFDLFVQSDRTLDRAQGGLGVGLAIVKRLVQMHGGSVTAASPGLGHGSTFEIRLPRITRPQASSTDGTPVKAPPRRVFIVDDNVDAARSLAMLLKFQGHEAETAYSGRDALERIEAFKPDVALLDIGLPEMSGYELAKRLRTLPALNGLRLVALTGYGQPDDRQLARAAGFDDHLVKPVDLAALERTLAGISTKATEDE